MNPASDAALQRIFGPLAATLSENLRRTAFEQFSEPKKNFENLSREEELVLGHLYYEQKQTIDDLVKNSGLSKAVVRNVVESLPHFIKKDKNDIFSAPVINKTKARELVEPASEKRNKQI